MPSELSGGMIKRAALARAAPVSIALLRVDPWFDSIRNDPRFQALLAGR